MPELDLIPADYRQTLQTRGWLVRFSLIYGLLVAVVGCGWLGLQYQQRQLQDSVTALQEGKRLSAEQRGMLDGLNAQRATVRRRLQILDQLRGGPPAKHMFVVIDRVLSADTWFSKWTFRRAGEFTEVEPEAVSTGYFIIVPEINNAANNKEEAWRLATHMEVTGQALDHSQLSKLVRRLIDQPEINDVQVLRTALHKYPGAQVVDFDLAITVNGHYGA